MSRSFVNELIRFNSISTARLQESLAMHAAMVSTQLPARPSLASMSRELIRRLPQSLEVAVAECVRTDMNIEWPSNYNDVKSVAFALALRPRFEWLDHRSRIYLDHVVAVRIQFVSNDQGMGGHFAEPWLEFKEAIAWTTVTKLAVEAVKQGGPSQEFHVEQSIQHLSPWQP